VIPRPLALAIVLALCAAPAFGQREDAGALRAQAREKARERELMLMDARQAARKVERLREQLVRLAQRQAVDENQALAQRARLTALGAREEALTAAMAGERGRQARLLSALQAYSRNPPPALLVSPSRANDAVRAAILMRALAPELERRAALLQARVDEVAAVRRAAAQASAGLFLTESELAEQRAETERLIADKRALERRLYAAADAAAREAEALARQADSLGGFVRDLGARSRQPTLVAPRRLFQPVEGRLVARFGKAAGGDDRRSEGLSWQTGPSAQVLAPAAGVVEYAGPLEGWGGVVILRLQGGYRVVLAGMDSVAALTGRRVAAGEPVGRMGPASGPGRPAAGRLYLELRRGDAPVDPSPWLDAVAER